MTIARSLACVALALTMAGCASDAVPRKTLPAEEKVRFERVTRFDGEVLHVAFAREDGTRDAFNSVRDEWYSWSWVPARPGYAGRRWTLLKTTAEQSSMVYALVSWNDDDPTDYLAAGWWLRFPGQYSFRRGLSLLDAEGDAFIDGPELDISSPPRLPDAGGRPVPWSSSRSMGEWASSGACSRPWANPSCHPIRIRTPESSEDDGAHALGRTTAGRSSSAGDPPANPVRRAPRGVRASLRRTHPRTVRRPRPETFRTSWNGASVRRARGVVPPAQGAPLPDPPPEVVRVRARQRRRQQGIGRESAGELPILRDIPGHRDPPRLQDLGHCSPCDPGQGPPGGPSLVPSRSASA